MINRNQSILSILQLFVFTALLAIFESTEMFHTEDVGVNSALQTLSTGLVLLLSSISFLYSLFRQRIVSNFFVKSYLLTFGFIYIISIMLSLFYPFGARQLYFTLFFPVLFFIYGYKCNASIHEDTIINILCLCAGFLIIYFFRTYNATKLNDIHSMGAYSILMFLPFILMQNKQIIKWVLLLCILGALMVSLKRGGLIAFYLAICAYYFVHQTNHSNGLKSILTLIIVGLLLCGLFIVANDKFVDGMMLERIQNIQEDEGSNRINVYISTINHIQASDGFKFIFGHGWNSLINRGPLFLSAHNDGLEIFYDCGCIAFFLYIVFIINILIYMFKLIKKHSKYAPAFAASITIYLINSNISHIVLYTKYMMIFALTWGFIVAGVNKEENR